MIFDLLTNSHLQPYEDAWKMAFRFIASLDENSEERRYELQGKEMYAVVERYQTKDPTIALPEAHQRYADIQVILSGAECIGWHPTSELTINTPYDHKKDIAFYAQPDTACTELALIPGRFALFLPSDAHMPGMHLKGKPAEVKKVVVKIAIELLGL